MELCSTLQACYDRLCTTLRRTTAERSGVVSAFPSFIYSPALVLPGWERQGSVASSVATTAGACLPWRGGSPPAVIPLGRSQAAGEKLLIQKITVLMRKI